MPEVTVQDTSVREQIHTGDAAHRAVRTIDSLLVSGNGQRVQSIGDNTIFTPPAGKAFRLLWINLNTPAANTASVFVTVKLGRIGSDTPSQTPYTLEMGAPFVFSHRTRRESLADESLIVNLTAAQAVDCNFDLEVF